MATFLDDLSLYNAKAALAISQAIAKGETEKASMMNGLKATANDTSLSTSDRLDALTALINIGNLLDVPLPPYFPVTTTYANTQTYTGIHNDLSGLQGGTAGEYYHLTQAQVTKVNNAAVLGDITWANLQGTYTSNAGLVAALNAKQNLLSGTGFVKISGTTISYDNTSYLSTITGINAGGELTGTYPNPVLSNAAVIGKVLTGWNGSASPAAITSSDTILTGLQKLNANLNDAIANPTGVASVSLTTNATGIFTTTSSPQTGAAVLDVSLNTQNANLFLASSATTNGQVPTFRAIAVSDLPSSGAAPGSYGSTLLIPVLSVDSKGRVTAITTVASASGGQVNSVTMQTPAGSIFNAINSGTAVDPIVGFTLGTQSANTVFAGPTTGSAATPGFRSLVLADIGFNFPITQIDGLQDALDGYLTDSLAVNTIFMGNTASAAVNSEVAGDLTATFAIVSGTNQAQFTIANGAVTYPKIQDVQAQTVLGRYSMTNGQVQELYFNASDFAINSSTGEIGLTSPNTPILTSKGDLLTHTGTALARLPIGANATFLMADTAATTGNKWVAMSGDATISVSGAVTIANSAVTLAKMANLAANTVIGNNTGSPAAPIALTKAQLTAMINQFSSSLSGVVPASGGGNVNFLRADGNWATPAGGGTVTTVSVVTANGFAGTVANASSTPAITLTTSVTGILKGNGTAMSAASAGTDYVAPGAITTSGLTMATARLLGRSTAATGAVEEIVVGSGLSLSGGTLSATSTGNVTSVTLNLGTTGLLTSGGTTQTITSSGTFAITGSLIVANGGTGLASGTQGGIPWFNGTTSMASSALLAANALMIGGGTGAAPSTITTGTGVLTALGINTGSAGAFVVNGGALGTPSSGTLTSCSGLPLSTGVTGTLPVGNGGTGQTSYLNGELLIGNTATGGLTKATLTAGTNITITNGNGTITIASTGGGGSSALNAITAATAANTPINNANFAQEWQWNTLAAGNGFFISSNSTAAASNNQTLFRVGLSGTNATSGQTTYAAQISNSHAGTTSTNVALSLSATNGTTINYALDVSAGIVRMAASSAAVPHMVFTPGSAALTGTTNGMLSYATVASNSSFYLYKDSAVTKLITLDRNPDFATGSSQGIIVADTAGTLSKSADLTALGVFSVHANTGNITTNATETTMIGTSLVGSTTLPANFFGVGKTVRIYASGTVDNANADSTTIRFKLGGTTIGTFSIATMPDTTANDFVLEAYIICNAAGASGTVRVGATFYVEGSSPSNEHTWYMPVATQAGTINTTNALALDITNQWGQTACTMVVNFMTCYYLN